MINTKHAAVGSSILAIVDLSTGAYMDNIRVTATSPVPEPSTLVLLSTGLIGLVAYAWRKRRQA
jgi:hypothetical protein